MPPVRWKLALVALCALISYSNGQASKVDAMPMSEDGWRPIVGTAKREPQYQDEITHYRNPSQRSDPVKAETPIPTSPSTSATIPPPQSPPPKLTTKAVKHKNNANPQMHYNGKVAPHSKPHPPSNQGHKNVHGPHIPLSPKGHRGPPYKSHGAPKGQGHPHPSNKRNNKPSRGHPGHHRDEILSASASSNIGSYTYFNQGPSGIKTRIIHSPSHIDYNNHFAHPNGNPGYNNQPVQQYVFPKHPVQNDVYFSFQNQNDEYTRNLVPPPPYKQYPDKEHKVKNFYKPKEPGLIPVTEAINKVHEPLNKFKPIEKPASNLNPNLEVPPPHLQQTHFPGTFQQNPQAIDIQVTKEKLNVFHNNIPTNYRPLEQFSDFSPHFANKQPSEAPKIQTYEVTEGKFWHESIPIQQQFSTRIPDYHVIDTPFKQTIQPQETPKVSVATPIRVSTAKPVVVEPVQVHFLPTPYIPDISGPTIPTQSEVSTIYNEIAQINKQKTEQPGYFNVKEVSTHFPIVGKPQVHEFEDQYNVYNNLQYAEEIPTTPKNEDYTEKEEMAHTAPAPTNPPKTWQNQRNNVRRRRPTSRPKLPQVDDSIIGIVTESYEGNKEQMPEKGVDEVSKPVRPLRRRPTRLRTTEKPNQDSSVDEQPARKRQRVRVKPTQQTIEDYTSMPTNHKMTEDDNRNPTETALTGSENEYYHPQQTTEKQYQESLEEQYMESFQNIKPSSAGSSPIQSNINLYDLSNPYQKPSQAFQDFSKNYRQPISTRIQGTPEEEEEQFIYKPTTETLPTTNVHLPEKEAFYSTPNYVEPSLNTITIQEVQDPSTKETIETTLATTSTPSSTTTEATTPKTTRTRLRTNKYDTNRPRFSVKDYKNRLTQYASTTTTTEKPQASPRVRIPNRFRKPIAPSIAPENDEMTEAPRNRFVPKDARHRLNQEQADETTTEKQPQKIYSTRIRSFSRYRSTTEPPTTTQKVSIKPNLFANRRRPLPISLKARIASKQKMNNTEETTTMRSTELTTLDNKENEVAKEVESESQTTESFTFENFESTTEFTSHKIPDTEVAESTEKLEQEEEVPDIIRNESFMYSQRVSDLTSSAKYDQPGLFKAVSPNSRRVPSYFTIATDDPILPIEAFFPNLNSNNKE